MSHPDALRELIAGYKTAANHARAEATRHENLALKFGKELAAVDPTYCPGCGRPEKSAIVFANGDGPLETVHSCWIENCGSWTSAEEKTR